MTKLRTGAAITANTQQARNNFWKDTSMQFMDKRKFNVLHAKSCSQQKRFGNNT